MEKIACECGEIHSNTCGYHGVLYKYDEVIENDPIYPLCVFECGNCGNIMIDNPKNPREMKSYKPTSKECNYLLIEKEEENET